MATDYDAPRGTDLAEPPEPETLRALRAVADVAGSRPLDEATLNEDLVLPGADLSGEVLTVAVIPQQSFEFRCRSCFLVLHQTLRTRDDLCRDCA